MRYLIASLFASAIITTGGSCIYRTDRQNNWKWLSLPKHPLQYAPNTLNEMFASLLLNNMDETELSIPDFYPRCETDFHFSETAFIAMPPLPQTKQAPPALPFPSLAQLPHLLLPPCSVKNILNTSSSMFC